MYRLLIQKKVILRDAELGIESPSETEISDSHRERFALEKNRKVRVKSKVGSDKSYDSGNAEISTCNVRGPD